MIDLSKFEVFDFSEGVPYVSVTNNGLTFNKSVIMKMNYPSTVKFLIDATEKQIAIQTCDENEEKSIQFYKPKTNGVISVRLNARDLINTISRITGWNLKDESYRVMGVYIPECSLMLFDLKEAQVML